METNIKPTTSLFLDTRRKKSDSTFPVKLRLTYKGIRKYYAIFNISLSESDYLKVIGQKIPREKQLKQIRKDALDFKHQADEFINLSPGFTFQSFNHKFIKKGSNDHLPNDAFAYFIAYIDELKEESRLNTCMSYQYALKSLKEFNKGKTLPFESIDQRFLTKYENQMLSAGYSITSIGMWLRSLRAIINLAIRKGTTDNYPFGRGKFQIKNPPARKMALTTNELKKLFSYIPEQNSPEHYYFDLWKFSYLCNGMNVKDICHLKYSNIERGKLFYLREKTKRTNLKGKEIVIPLSDEIMEIINAWGQLSKKQDAFIFPILKSGMTAEESWAQIRQTVKQVNKYIKRVAHKLEIEVNISTYTARHSYATQLMRHGAPTEFISKQLGHASVETTNAYLENFEERQIDEWQKKITDFNL